jgi:hypothetical protein
MEGGQIMSEIDRIAAYEAWAGSDDYRLRLSTEHGFQGGWHARDEIAHQECAGLRETIDLRTFERDEERARAEAAEGRVRELERAILRSFASSNPTEKFTILRQAMDAPPRSTTSASTAGEPLNRLPTLTDPAASEAMRETERADGGGEEATGEASGP